VANRVRDEISEHLPESLLVGLENRLRLLDVGLEADVSLGRMCSPVVDDPPDQVAGARARALDENGAGLELRQVEKLLHQVAQPPDLAQKIF